MAPREAQTGRTVGRYHLFGEIGSGGMATVHIGRFVGPGGFSRTVAIKRMHAQYAKDPLFVSLFLDEARLAGRVQHPNVASMLDVVSVDEELLLVMDYVHGEPLSRLITLAAEAGGIPPRVSVGIMVGTLQGLHAAHEATSDAGAPLGIVHRDVSPQNILLGADGVPRLVDFGVAKAADRLQTTTDGKVKGKLAYMPPEQLHGGPVDRRVDIYAASVVLWELLTGLRLFAANNPGGIVARVLDLAVPPPSSVSKEVSKELDAIVIRGLSRDPADRFATAMEMTAALEEAMQPASSRQIAEWIAAVAGERLAARAQFISGVESVRLPANMLAEGRGGLLGLEKTNVPSQISTISVTTGIAGRSGMRLGAAIGVLAVVALATAAAFVRIHPKRSVVPDPGELVSVAVPPAATSSASSANEPVPPTVKETPDAVAPIAAEGVGSLSVSRPSRPIPPRSPRVSRPRSGGCDPPYTIDPVDPRIHVPKPQCL
jgi:eukaryotic-like serine/threonine-protein kinase